MKNRLIFTFSGKEVNVSWDQRLCIHFGECNRAKNDLFAKNREPWCEPDRVSSELAVDVVKRCPTGALFFEGRDGGEEEKPAAENTVLISNNGPLFVRGDLEIDGAPPDMPGVRFRAALCRCGFSKNKPFCDDSHEARGFSDYGSVGEEGDGNDGSGGKLTIQATPNGPLLLFGNFTITTGSGRLAWKGTQAALCRCGHSKNKPFCDGGHTKAGFKAG